MTEFKYFLNRQGVRGPQGPQGEKGFSPDISVEKDTLSEYILRITNEGGYFLTTNLREHKEDRGGTYIRYDRDTGVMYTGDADPASTDTLGVIRIAKDDDFVGKAEDAAVTPAQIQNYVTEKVDTVSQKVDTLDKTTVKLDGRQTITGSKYFSDRILTAKIVDNQSHNLINANQQTLSLGDSYFKLVLNTSSESSLRKGSTNLGEILAQKSVTAGDNIVITETTNGIQISSTSGDVYTTADNKFTGTNTFNKPVTVEDTLTVYGSPISNKPDLVINKQAASSGILDYGPVGLLIRGTSKTGTVTNGLSISDNDIMTYHPLRVSGTVDEDRPYFLHQNSVTAGNNISLEKTTDGIKISSTGGGLEVKSATMANFNSAELLETGLYYISAGLSPQNGPVAYSVAAMLITMKWYSEGANQRIQQTWIGCEDLVGNQIYTRYSKSNGVMNAWTRVDSNKIASASALGSIKVGDGLTVSTDGTLSTLGGGSGDATKAGNNTFTGNNTFDGETTFNAHTWTAEQEAVTLNVTSNATLQNAYVTGTLSSLGEITAVSIQAAGIKNNQNNKYYLTQASITAGSDNLVIAETETGIKIVCNAPTNAQLAQLQELITDLSTKIDNLTNRVRDLEQQIDGGVA